VSEELKLKLESVPLGGETKILGGKVVKSDKCMDFSQLFGKARALAAPPKSTPIDPYST